MLPVAGIILDVNAEAGDVRTAGGAVVAAVNDVLLIHADEHVFEVLHLLHFFGPGLLDVLVEAPRFYAAPVSDGLSVGFVRVAILGLLPVAVGFLLSFRPHLQVLRATG